MPRTAILAVCCSLAVLTLCLPAGAAVFERDWLTPGDGLLTFDDINQREWLDLTETQLFNYPGDTLEEQFAAVVEMTANDQALSGFLVATEEDVRGLATSAGINTSTLSIATNGEPANTLISLIGNTISPTTTGENRRAGGFVASIDPGLASVWITYNPNSRSQRNAGFRDLSGDLEPTYGFFGPPPLLDSSGVWLYRVVPEPTNVASLLLACSIAPRTILQLPRSR